MALVSIKILFLNMSTVLEDDYHVIKEMDLTNVKFVWRSDNILHYFIKKDRFLTLDDVHEVLEVVMNWGESNKYLHLFEGGYNSSIDTDVREWASSDSQNKHTVADAIIVKNMAQRIVGNFYLQFNRPVKPTKLFTNKKDSIEWLRLQGDAFLEANPDWNKQTII
jgi:hypothetical protein